MKIAEKINFNLQTLLKLLISKLKHLLSFKSLQKRFVGFNERRQKYFGIVYYKSSTINRPGSARVLINIQFNVSSTYTTFAPSVCFGSKNVVAEPVVTSAVRDRNTKASAN